MCQLGIDRVCKRRRLQNCRDHPKEYSRLDHNMTTSDEAHLQSMIQIGIERPAHHRRCTRVCNYHLTHYRPALRTGPRHYLQNRKTLRKIASLSS